MTAPLHQWSDHANKTIAWLPPDSQQAYQQHVKDPESRRLLETFGWLDSQIQYSFNAHGFRTDEFDPRPNWVALGCSFTQGTGVNQQDRWTDIVSDQLGLHCWNLGVAGAAGDTCYRIARYWLPKLRPRFVVYLEPRYNRTEMKIMDQDVPAIINWAYDSHHWSGTYTRHLLAEPDNFDINAEKNRESIRSMCLQLQIPILIYAPNDFVDLIPSSQRDLARDLLHAGRRNQRAWAEVVRKDIHDKT
jgi:hypothetical protein